MSQEMYQFPESQHSADNNIGITVNTPLAYIHPEQLAREAVFNTINVDIPPTPEQLAARDVLVIIGKNIEEMRRDHFGLAV